jgi:hypothetical protein
LVSRDFKAEAIAARKLAQQQQLQANKYKAPQRSYAFQTKPEGLSDEQWRYDCEIRWFLDALPNKEQRHRYLLKVEEHRGKAARQQLERDAMKTWQKRKQ